MRIKNGLLGILILTVNWVPVCSEEKNLSEKASLCSGIGKPEYFTSRTIFAHSSLYYLVGSQWQVSGQ